MKHIKDNTPIKYLLMVGDLQEILQSYDVLQASYNVSLDVLRSAKVACARSLALSWPDASHCACILAAFRAAAPGKLAR